MLRLPAKFHPTHQTSGLQGFPAVDCFALAGTPVASPATGKVVKLSGAAPTAHTEPGGPYGWSVYITARDGGTYFVTHLGRRSEIVKLGDCIGKGEIIGAVADYTRASDGATPSHIHMGFHAGPWEPPKVRRRSK